MSHAPELSDEAAAMVDDAQSQHERLMKTICGRLLAAPFVFCPELWSVGPNKMREPADLIWACNNCIILMYLRQTKLYDDAEKDGRKFEDGADHNMRQAKGGHQGVETNADRGTE